MTRFLPALLVAALALPAFAQGPTVWEHDLEAAKARAKREHKQIFMDVWAEWCGPCQRMRSEVFPSPEAQIALRNFVPLSACVQTKDGKSTPETPIGIQYKVEMFPSLFVVDENGTVVRYHAGYLPPAQFAAFLAGSRTD
jgi:thioredoxin-related protein